MRSLGGRSMAETDRVALRGQVSRRTAFKLVAALGSLSALNLLAACAPTAQAPAPTAAPAKPAEPQSGATPAAKPAATTAPAAKPAATTAPAASTQAGPGKMGGSAKVALYSEPPTLDSTWTTGILVVVPSQHVFEYLFALDSKWDVKPLLANGFQVGDGGKSYTIPLRKGIKFHNGKEMTAEDVVASLDRWGKLSGDGKLAYKSIARVSAQDASTVKIDMQASFAPLITYLAGP